MYSFVVLGQVPGTSITISFTMWVQLVLAVIAVATWYIYTHSHKATSSDLHGHPASIMVVRNGKPVPANEISL